MASVRAVIIWDGKLLMLQRSSDSSRAGQWCLPGGRVHEDEGAEAAVVRETREEADIEIRVLGPLQQFGSCQYFLCQLDPLCQSIHLHGKESQDHAWIDPNQIEPLGLIMDYRQICQILVSLPQPA